jgi:hypothetical protein
MVNPAILLRGPLAGLRKLDCTEGWFEFCGWHLLYS